MRTGSTIDEDTDLLESQPSGPRVIAAFFKVAAVLAVLIGTSGAIGVGAGTSSSSTTNTVAIAVGIGVGGIFVGAAFAFFGYMLELVVGIKDDLGVLSYIAIGSEDDGDEGR